MERKFFYRGRKISKNLIFSTYYLPGVKKNYVSNYNLNLMYFLGRHLEDLFELSELMEVFLPKIHLSEKKK